jgi:hypothetical protein
MFASWLVLGAGVVGVGVGTTKSMLPDQGSMNICQVSRTAAVTGPGVGCECLLNWPGGSVWSAVGVL